MCGFYNMNAKRALYIPCVKYVLLTFFITSSIIIYTSRHGHANLTFSTKHNGPDVYTRHVNHVTDVRVDLYPKLGTTPFPHDIRNDWPKYDVKDVAIYILSAIGSNTTEHVTFTRDIRLNGWLDEKDLDKRIKCCFLWTDRTISEFYDPTTILKRRTKLVASQIVCPFNASFSGVSGVTALSANATCPSADDTIYIKPYIPKKADNEHSFAICLKLVYGKVDTTLFIDWLEFHREVQVDKIFMFTYNIDETTELIIRHYVQIGLVERRPFGGDPEKQTIGRKSSYYFEDERVILFDCLQRSAGYKYMAIVDMDEFLLPRKYRNVKDLMQYLTRTDPNAAGFMLSSYIFVKSVKPDSSAPTNGSDIVKYFRRTQALSGARSRRKNILLTSRITARGLYTHWFKPALEHYTSVSVNSTLVAINHYRDCYSNFEDICHDKQLITDKYILKYVKKFRNRIWNPETEAR